MRPLIPAVLSAVLSALVAAGAAAAPCKVPPEQDLAGLYTLEGVFEVGSQFVLFPDGRFEFMLAYGAIDQYGQGCWEVAGDTLLLRQQGRRNVPARHYPDDRRFRGMALVVEKDGLRWPLPGTRALYRKSD